MDKNYNNEHKNNIVNYYFVSSAHDKDKMNKFNIITDTHNFTIDNFIKIKNETILNNNLITNTKSEENPKMTNEVKSIKIQSSMSNKDNNGEAIENLNFLNNIEEIKEKNTFLDKST